jgi:hypothetical protein
VPGTTHGLGWALDTAPSADSVMAATLLVTVTMTNTQTSEISWVFSLECTVMTEDRGLVVKGSANLLVDPLERRSSPRGSNPERVLLSFNQGHHSVRQKTWRDPTEEIAVRVTGSPPPAARLRFSRKIFVADRVDSRVSTRPRRARPPGGLWSTDPHGTGFVLTGQHVMRRRRGSSATSERHGEPLPRSAAVR